MKIPQLKAVRMLLSEVGHTILRSHFQAVFFYAPSLVWKTLNNKAGVDSDDIMHAADQFDKTEKMEDRDRILKLIVNQIDRFVGSSKRRRPKRNRGIGKGHGNYLVVLYFVVKVLYAANIFSQLFVLNKVLGTEFNTFGIHMLERIQDDEFGTVHANSSYFPRVTMCNFRVRRLGNVHRYAVQCVLPINLYAEKMFIFLWFWMCIVLAMTFLSLIVWILQMTLARDKKRYVQNHLRSEERIETDFDQQLSNDFVDHYLRSDGVFLLRLISHNTNNITATEVICALWDNWKTGNPFAKETPPPPLSAEQTPEKEVDDDDDGEPRYVPNLEKPSLPEEKVPLYPSAPEPSTMEKPPLKPPVKPKPPPPPKPSHLAKQP